MLPTQKQELNDLLERVPLMLRADQQRPVETSIVAEIDAFDLSGCSFGDFTPRERVALGNYYFTKGMPVEAIQYYWSAVKDGDEYIKSISSNNAGVTHFGFCPGMAPEILEEVV
jgi:hypothetical protein